MNEQTINANIAHCLRTAHNFGSEKVYNICNGQITEVPWGTMDYLGVSALIAFGITFILVLLALAFMLIREW